MHGRFWWDGNPVISRSSTWPTEYTSTRDASEPNDMESKSPECIPHVQNLPKADRVYRISRLAGLLSPVSFEETIWPLLLEVCYSLLLMKVSGLETDCGKDAIYIS